MHIDERALAGQALGEPDALDGDDRRHLETCRRCLAALTDLQGIAELGRDTPRIPLQAPGPQLLDRINAELAAGEPVSAGAPAISRRPRRFVLLAAAVGLVLGVGGTVAYERLATPSTEVLATATLAPLPGQTGTGRAELVRADGVESLRVQVVAGTPDGDFHELWLINTDGRRMISLGVLAPSGQGSYPLPSQLAAGLQDYTTVDVSLEPYDGDAAHSLKSVVRGSLS